MAVNSAYKHTVAFQLHEWTNLLLFQTWLCEHRGTNVATPQARMSLGWSPRLLWHTNLTPTRFPSPQVLLVPQCHSSTWCSWEVRAQTAPVWNKTEPCNILGNKIKSFVRDFCPYTCSLQAASHALNSLVITHTPVLLYPKYPGWQAHHRCGSGFCRHPLWVPSTSQRLGCKHNTEQHQFTNATRILPEPPTLPGALHCLSLSFVPIKLS